MAIIFFIFISNPFEYYFLNDDFIHIPEAAKGGFFQSRSLLRPISELTLWIDSKLWSDNAYGFHITNILIHLGNVCLVFVVSGEFYRQVVQDKKKVSLIPLIAATLFLLYSFHSESIYWIIGRGASLTTLFFLSAFLFFLLSKKPADKYFFLCLLFFSLGLLTYELIWIFPSIVLLFYIIFNQRNKIALVVAVWVFFVAYLVLKVIVTDVLVGSYEAEALMQFDLKRLLYNLNTLIARSFLPPMSNSIAFLVSYLILLCFLGYFLFMQRRSKIILFFLASFIISLLPVLAMGIDTHDTESERFIYLASFFVIMLLAEILMTFNNKTVFPAFMILLICYAFLLSLSANSYKVAGAIARSSLSCLGANKYIEDIYLIKLPTQYKGSLIFRIGFPEAIRWINNISWGNIHMVSNTEVVGEVKELRCVEKKKESLAGEVKDERNKVVIEWNNSEIHVQKK